MHMQRNKLSLSLSQSLFIFPRRHQWYLLFGCETHANRAITAQIWDYLVYLYDLAVHKDHLPNNRIMSQSALLL